MRTLVLLPLAWLFAVGCSSSPTDSAPGERVAPLRDRDGIVFAAERSAYRQGDTASIVLRNGTDQDLGYNFCLSSRELKAGVSRTRIRPLRTCALVLLVIRPGAEAVLKEPITAEWQPGEYRMVTAVERLRSGERGEIFTPPFTVQR